MSELDFEVLDAYPDPVGADPTMLFAMRVNERSGDPVHTMSLRAQIQIDAPLRDYAPEETELLVDLFGDEARWATTLRTFNWTHATALLDGFRDSVEFELRVPCTYDFEVSAAKYLHGLRGGEVPLEFLFSGTVVSRGATGYSVTQIPWDRAARFCLPVSTWRALVDRYWPGGGWIRVHRDTLDDLLRYKAAHGLPGWDHTFEHLLEGSP